MSDVAFAERICELFFEQDTPVLATSYKHGVFRSLVILARTLFFSRMHLFLESPIVPHSSVAVVFFPNEYEAIRRAPPEVLCIDRLIRFDPHALALIRRTIGIGGTLKESINFIQAVVRVKGWHAIGRATYPLLGWLLYRTFSVRLARVQGVKVVTTNMQHPLSIGVAWAAAESGQASLFYEHATTPRLVFNSSRYNEYYVQFEHTKRMFTELGVDPSKITVLQPLGASLCARATRVRRVGVCINILDTLEAVALVTEVLRKRCLEVVYRIHDADPRISHFRRMAKRENATLSDARRSRIEDFLTTVDLVVVGNSNVVADALLANCQVIYFWSGGREMFDYYGLITHYKVPYATDRSTFDLVLGTLTSAQT